MILSRSTKLIIEVIGILMSLISIGLLFKNEYFVSACILIIVAMIFVGLALKLAFSSPFEMKYIKFDVSIKDEDGKFASLAT